MRNNKYILILLIIVFIIIIALFMNSSKKVISNEVSLHEPKGNIQTFENVKYVYDNTINKYKVYDENNKEIGSVISESEVKKYVDNPDYDSSKRPNGFVESIDKKSIDEPTLLETEDSAINGEAKK